MGLGTGDRIAAAPAPTLTDREFRVMRDRTIACICGVGVGTGRSNVRFAVARS